MAKRIYIKGAPYHITMNVKARFPFFQEDIFCNILIDDIANCKTIKPFELISFKINPDHAHIILQQTGDYNYSQILQNIKRTSSTQINQLIFYQREENPYKNLKWTPTLKLYNRLFIRKYNYKGAHEFPAFQWQEGSKRKPEFITTMVQLNATIHYHERQSLKHDLEENKFLFVADELPPNLVLIGEKKYDFKNKKVTDA